MEHKIDESQSFITDKIVQVYEEHYPNKAVYKSRGRDDRNNKVVDVIAGNNASKTETVEHDEGTKIDFRFTESGLEKKVKKSLGISTSTGSQSSGGRPSRDVSTRGRYNGDDDDEDKEEERRRRRRSGSRSEGKSMDLMGVNSDGSITMMPPFTKEEAQYDVDISNPYHCGDCVHYVEGGGCTLVQGEIEPEGYCENFFAEVGMFGSQFSDPVLNLKLWGDDYSMGMKDIDEFIDQVEEALENK
jgi:hypothetical protein